MSFSRRRIVQRIGGGGIAPPPGDWTFNNIPSGFVLGTESDHSQTDPPGWGVWLNSSITEPFVVEGPTPVDNHFIRQTWEGVTDAQDAGWVRGFWGTQTEYFFATIQRFSPTWVWGSGHGLKMHVLHGGVSAGWLGCGRWKVNDFTTTCFQWGDQMDRPSQGLWGPLGASEVFDGNGDRIDQNPGPGVGVPNGEWFKLEMYMNYVTGVVIIWVNDTIVNDSRDPSYPLFPYSFPEWAATGAVRMGATLGGGSGMGTLTADYYIDYAHTAIYVPGP